jgi:hypothetical protein
VPATVRKMVQFREGRRGFHRRTERGMPVCSKEERKPVTGALDEEATGVVALDEEGAGSESALHGGRGGSGAAMAGRNRLRNLREGMVNQCA